ncbi:restriction endonuclease subunit S [Achromobacter insolitus]|uniref:restriction endonuclease subunit S n=1 Tax=Achromobacter insolitus TaxID=217204 RepID=UPI001EEE6F06|nr:restriction endonuclease subunit S [Achromobacter insolitus]
MSQLPLGWAKATIGDVCDLVNGKAFKPSDWSKSGLPIIRIQNLNKPNVKFNHFDGEIEDRFLVEGGDLLFAWSGTPGTSFGAHLWDGPKAVLNQHIFNVRFDQKSLDRTFLRYAINQTLDEQIAKAHGGVGLRHVTKGKFEETEVFVPPLPEQRRIVAKIDSLTGKSRRAREHLDHIPRLVEKYKQAILAASFRGDAELARVGDVITDIRYGTAKKCNYDGGAVPVLRIPNVQGGRIDLRDMKSADFDTKELLKLELRIGDILVIRSNGSLDLVGRSAVVDDRAAGMLFAGYLIRLRLDPTRCLPEYLHWFLQSAVARNTITNAAKSTSGVNNVNAQELQNLALPLPSIAAQKERIVSIVSAFTWIDRLTGEANSARKLIDYLEQSVLAKAFKGELVLQDPTDEPASALLDRIKAERAAAPKVRRGRKKAA